VATSRRVPKESGSTEYVEETQWHKVVVWGKEGERCAQYLKKGNAVYIEGSFRSHSYDGKNGQERVSYEVWADNVVFLGGGRIPERALEEAG